MDESELGPVENVGEVGVVEGQDAVLGVLSDGERQELRGLRDGRLRAPGSRRRGRPCARRGDAGRRAGRARAPRRSRRDSLPPPPGDRDRRRPSVPVPVAEALLAERQVLAGALAEARIVVDLASRRRKSPAASRPVLLLRGGDGASEELELRIPGCRGSGGRAMSGRAAGAGFVAERFGAGIGELGESRVGVGRMDRRDGLSACATRRGSASPPPSGCRRRRYRWWRRPRRSAHACSSACGTYRRPARPRAYRAC